MKKLITLILFSTLIFTGCDFALDHDDSVLFFSSRPITRETFDPNMVQNTFEKGQQIHYCIWSKEPFNTNAGRFQILKKDTNTNIYGFSLAQAGDINLNPTKNYYTGSFTIYSDGYYLLRIFSKNRPSDPLAQKTFWITQDN